MTPDNLVVLEIFEVELTDSLNVKLCSQPLRDTFNEYAAAPSGQAQSRPRLCFDLGEAVIQQVINKKTSRLAGFFCLEASR